MSLVIMIRKRDVSSTDGLPRIRKLVKTENDKFQSQRGIINLNMDYDKMITSKGRTPNSRKTFGGAKKGYDY